MRVTDRLMFERSSRELGGARSALDQAREALSTGRRVDQPGDDPGVAGAIAAFGISSQRADALAKATRSASEELQSVDGALGTVSNALARAQELAVQFSNDTYSASDRAAGALELNSIIGTVVAALNTRYANRYVFGGFKDDAPPFDPAGSYHGDAGVRQVEIAPGVMQATSIRADVALKGAGGGVDVLATLGELQSALAANAPMAIHATVDGLGRSVSQVATARAELGVSMDALDAAAGAAKAAASDEKARIATLSQTDVADGAIQLAQAQNALEAAMAATTQSLKLSLLDYLR